MKIQWLLFLAAAFVSEQVQAYDPCDVKFSLGSLAPNQCYRIAHPSDALTEGFTISAVKLTKVLATAQSRDDVILVPGGPGSDSQAIGLSLNKKGMLDALWAHMNLNVVLYDPRGTGNSLLKKSAEYYAPSVFATEVQVKDLQMVIDTVSPTKPVYLLAHSAGGDLAARYAALFPGRVKGLILYSASIDTREIGESNLRLFAREFAHWDQYLRQCPVPVARTLKEKLSHIESFLRNVLKLQRIENVRPAKLQGRFYLKDFRVEMITAIENDPDCAARVPTVLDRWQKKIDDLPADIKENVARMSAVSFDPNNHSVPKLLRGTWIRTAVICSEGITTAEMKAPLWLEGIDFSQDTCFAVEAIHAVPPSRQWLAQISSPTLLIGGTEDPFQIPSAVARNAKAIAGSEVVFISGGGHESHLNSPMEFYKAVDKFFKKVGSKK